MRQLKPFQPSGLTTGAAVATTLVVASVAGVAQLCPARDLQTTELTRPSSQLINPLPVHQTNKVQSAEYTVQNPQLSTLNPQLT